MYVAEARDALIYEIKLSSLKTIHNASPKQKQYKQHKVTAFLSGLKPNIIDLKIHQDMAYVVNGKNRLERFNLTEGARSMAPFGPAEFFRVTALSVYSETFYSTYIKPVNNPCEKNECREICVALSDTESTCLCRDGMKPLRNVCILDPTPSADTQPPVPINCPDNIEVRLPTCAASLKQSWTPPTWQDETTAAKDLTITLPALSPPARLAAGRVEITYAARDKVGNIGYCRFVINVIDNRCPAVPGVRPGMKRTKPTCENREGSVFTISCIDELHVMWIPDLTGEGRQHSSYQVKCSKNLRWESSLLVTFARCKTATTLTTTEEITTAEITPISSTPSVTLRTASITTVTNSATSKSEKHYNFVVNGIWSNILRAILFCDLDDNPRNSPCL